MKQSLELLLSEGVIDEVLGKLKSGKEAEVWIVERAGEIIAAKVYTERHLRSFKQNTAYLEGRQVRSSRTQRAIDKGSRFGRSAAEEAWKSSEADALYTLHAAGVRVPKPVLFYEGVLLMELVIDREGHPAPRLVDAPIERTDARGLYEQLRGETVKMLCADLIHGDLSPYNTLFAWDGPVIIDFPQVIAAATNNRAEAFFKRDVENLRTFFAGLDPSLHESRGDADEIWRAYVRRELTPGFVPSGRPPRHVPAAHAPHAGRERGAPGPRGGGAGAHPPRGNRHPPGGPPARDRSSGGPREQNPPAPPRGQPPRQRQGGGGGPGRAPPRGPEVLYRTPVGGAGADPSRAQPQGATSASGQPPGESVPGQPGTGRRRRRRRRR